MAIPILLDDGRVPIRTRIAFSLGDFGTGDSSLSYLRRLPIDTVKIDRSFVHSIAHNDRDRTFVESILSMAKLLGLEVVVEGVEDEAQRDGLYDDPGLDLQSGRVCGAGPRARRTRIPGC